MRPPAHRASPARRPAPATPNCARLPSLADGAFGARPFPTPGRAPRNSDRAGGPHDLGVLTAPAVRAARICSRSLPIGARRSPSLTGPQEWHASDPQISGRSSHRHGAVRRRSTSTAVGAHPSPADAPGTTIHTSSLVPAIASASRGAVTRQGAALAARPQGLTATAAHNRPRSAGDAVRPADLNAAFAVSPSSRASITRQLTHASSQGDVLPSRQPAAHIRKGASSSAPPTGTATHASSLPDLIAAVAVPASYNRAAAETTANARTPTDLN